jgi:hypothetical protein
MALGSTQPLTEMSTRNLPGGVKVGRCVSRSSFRKLLVTSWWNWHSVPAECILNNQDGGSVNISTQWEVCAGEATLSHDNIMILSCILEMTHKYTFTFPCLQLQTKLLPTVFNNSNNWNSVTCFCANLSECIYLWGKHTRLLELGNKVKRRIFGSSMYRRKAGSFKIRRFIISKLYLVLLIWWKQEKLKRARLVNCNKKFIPEHDRKTVSKEI